MRFAVLGLFPVYLALLFLPLRAADSVLFIGNSFTFGAAAPVVMKNGGVPKLFQEIARAEGKKVDAFAVTSGGKDWAWHLDQPITARSLAARPWDWVVLQDYSTRPTHVGDIRDFMRDGEIFSDRIAANSLHAGVILFETWARPPIFYTGQPGRDFSGPAQMLRELHDSYARLRDDLAKRDPARPVRVALVGTAFAQAGDRYPAINLNASDNHHATAEGYYLAALVIYETIYHGSVKGAPAVFFHGALKFPHDVAAELQGVADEIAGGAVHR
jgi:hypothetical protein